ncbi:MAG: alternative ribosome rescue aminoacyl-tRNA hydrolase ArfB [Anaerolineales bacterium]|jgi:ribosome-associated protein
MELTSGLTIQENELIFSFVRSSGPGGQNVNKVATSAQLRFDVRNSPSLTAEMKERLARLAGNRMTNDGTLVIEAKRYRTQEHNRADALLRLEVLLEKAAIQPKIRHATRPSLRARLMRVATKKKRGAVKKLRRPSNEE